MQLRTLAAELGRHRCSMRGQNRNVCPLAPANHVHLAAQNGAKWLKLVERVKGIEPSSSAWKAVALPLSYTRMEITEPTGAGPVRHLAPIFRPPDPGVRLEPARA
jgi:hypothetical protein